MISREFLAACTLFVFAFVVFSFKEHKEQETARYQQDALKQWQIAHGVKSE